MATKGGKKRRAANVAEAILETSAAAEASVPHQARFGAANSQFGAETAIEEPVFDEAARREVQGNIIPGFNKDHQHFLFFGIGKKSGAKKWLRWIGPMISSMDEVLAFNRLYRAMRFKLGRKDVPIKATWVNIGFSYGAIAALLSREEANRFGDQSFRQGLAARAEYIGDPSRKSVPGNKSKWIVGGPKNEADILVIVASDDPRDLDTTINSIKEQAGTFQLKLMFEQRGDTLPDPLRGHEHFGFKDGVSQPGVRGKASAAPGDFITPRFIAESDDRARLFAKPGQPLVWPGQFLLGERRQHSESLYESSPAAGNFPKWAHLGSYLVWRRLRQDVNAFWDFAMTTAATLGIPAVNFASMMVGRWPSGAPVMRTPARDNAALAADDLANNHFLFDDDTRPIALLPVPGYAGDTHSGARADLLGQVCPHFAHVRKVNPRDSSSDLGKSADNLLRMILRRGIPFGPPIVGIKDPPASLVKQERGLIFVSYQSSIEDQFEFLHRRWSNSPIQPNFGGHDPIIGARDERGARDRFMDFPTRKGTTRIAIQREWVITTGGGYFFAPPVNAVAGVLGA